MDSAVRWLSSLNAITADIPETCSGGSTMAPTPPTLTFYASSELSHFLFHLRILSESESSDSSAIDGAGAVSEDCGGIVPRLTRWLSSTIIGGDGPWFGHCWVRRAALLVAGHETRDVLSELEQVTAYHTAVRHHSPLSGFRPSQARRDLD